MLHSKHTKNKNRIPIKKSPVWHRSRGTLSTAVEPALSAAHAQVGHTPGESTPFEIVRLEHFSDGSEFGRTRHRWFSIYFVLQFYLGTFSLETKDKWFYRRKKIKNKILVQAPLGVSYGGWCYAFCEQYGSLWLLHLDSGEPADDRRSQKDYLAETRKRYDLSSLNKSLHVICTIIWHIS